MRGRVGGDSGGHSWFAIGAIAAEMTLFSAVEASSFRLILLFLVFGSGLVNGVDVHCIQVMVSGAKPPKTVSAILYEMAMPVDRTSTGKSAASMPGAGPMRRPSKVRATSWASSRRLSLRSGWLSGRLRSSL